jgi:undecaprenyl diphosphate synthase
MGEEIRNTAELSVPAHVAIILDGNGRWAKKRGLPRSMGHKEGCRVVEQTVEDAARLGIRFLTVYGFSTENWKRSDDEVSALMQLFRFYMKRLLGIAKANNVRVLSIGDRSRFAPDIIEGINALERETADNTGLTFVIAVNYGGRDEIRRAARKIAEEVKEGILSPEDITEDTVTARLDTARIPDPDLLIRTGGEMRLSNYLLWQCAYTEFYVTDLLWPDFSRAELEKAIRVYNSRDRRFGGVKEKRNEQN